MQIFRPAHLCIIIALTMTNGCLAIVGGRVVNPPNLLPWIVSIRLSGRHQCGGSLISPRWMLTAGHCGDEEEFGFGSKPTITNTVIHKAPPKRVTIFISGIQSELAINQARIHLHPEFSKITLRHDIALWNFDSPIEIGQWPVLDSSVDSYAGWLALAFGWGSDWQFGAMSHNLHKVALPILAKDACRVALGDSFLGPGMMCAGGLEDQDTCRGDSGGPLILHPPPNFDVPATAKLVGIVSWGLQCGLNGYPGIYTSVSEHLSWINDLMHREDE